LTSLTSQCLKKLPRFLATSDGNAFLLLPAFTGNRQHIVENAYAMTHALHLNIFQLLNSVDNVSMGLSKPGRPRAKKLVPISFYRYVRRDGRQIAKRFFPFFP
jgi:hypothetical protein